MGAEVGAWCLHLRPVVGGSAELCISPFLEAVGVDLAHVLVILRSEVVVDLVGEAVHGLQATIAV